MDYEQERKKKIDRNKAMLAELGLDKKELRPKTTRKPRKRPRTQSNLEATRKSARLSDKSRVNYSEKRGKKKQQNKINNVRVRHETATLEKEDDEVIETSHVQSDGTRKSRRLAIKKRVFYNVDKYSSESEGERNDSNTNLTPQQKRKKRNNQSGNSSEWESDASISGSDSILDANSDSETELPKKSKFRLNSEIQSRPRTRSQLHAERQISPHVTSVPLILFTGVPKDMLYHYSEIVSILGGRVVEEATVCSHLVSSCLQRTLKLLCSFRNCRYFLTPKWLEQSKKAGSFLEENKFWIEQPSFPESCSSISLKETVARAQKLETSIFCGYKIFITPNVLAIENLKEMIKTYDGKVMKEPPNDQSDLSHCLVITSDEDLSHWSKQLSNLKDLRFFNSEFVFLSILKQKMEIHNPNCQYK